MTQLTSAMDAISQAVEGGYKLNDVSKDYHHEFIRVLIMTELVFWQALGKARGWIDKNYPNGEMRCEAPKCDSRYCGNAGFRNPLDVAHEWFEVRLSNGDEQAFWQSLP